ncbi:MAG TPA: TonB-dependent receptor, partial [Edaphobacter sp.]|nr:TonB-dependent receptor [Edaphobacter sp.]
MDTFRRSRLEHPRSPISLSVLFGLVLFLMTAFPALAQIAGGSISGTVVDPSQSVIPQAQVTARNTATGVEVKAATNQTGYYEFPLVVPGAYAVTVQASGFGDAVTSTFAVVTGQRSQVNVQLKLGSASENVQVSATTQLLNSVSADLGTAVEPQKINNLPLNQRNFFPLIGLQPGVNANSGSTTLNGRGGFEVNGAPGLANNILIDGVDATFGESNSLGSAIGGTGSNINTMSVDAIDEFRTTSSVPSAQYGRASGGILTMTTKSGTNNFHGNLFEYIRNDAFDANTWNNKHVVPVVVKPKLRYNDFGGNIGGPIFHDKAFFFFNYEGDRQNSAQTMTGDTATPALIASVSNPAIATELSLMPKPNSTTSNPLIGFFTGNRSITLDENVYLGHVDWNLKNHRFMVRYNYNDQQHQIQQFRADDSQGFPLTSQNAAIEDVWTASPNVVNEFRLGLNRNILNRNTTGYDTDPTQSWIILTGFFQSDTTQSHLFFQSTTYGLVDNLTWLHGKHTFRFGTDDRLVPARRTQFTSPRSTYASIADLQNDNPQSLAVSFGGPKHLTSSQWAGYAEDSYRMTTKLTTTYGVRYDYFSPMSGGYNVNGDSPFGPLFTDRNHPFMTAGHYDFAPRVGFAYQVTPKLVVRSGFGLMFVPPQPFFMFSSAFASPLLPFDASFLPSQVPANFSVKYPISRTLITQYTADPTLIPAGLTFGRFIAQYHHPEEYSENWNLNAQYQFTPDLYLQVGYVGMSDRHELSTALPNQFLAGTCSTPSCPGGTVPDPAIGVIDYNVFG